MDHQEFVWLDVCFVDVSLSKYIVWERYLKLERSMLWVRNSGCHCNKLNLCDQVQTQQVGLLYILGINPTDPSLSVSYEIRRVVPSVGMYQQ